jgi:hypothetical protein
MSHGAGLTESPSETRDSHDSRAVAEVGLVGSGEVVGGLLAVQAVAERCAEEDTGSGSVESSQDLEDQSAVLLQGAGVLTTKRTM